jgi:hypothetical protein
MRVQELEGKLVGASHSATESQVDMSDSRTISECEDDHGAELEHMGTPE